MIINIKNSVAFSTVAPRSIEVSLPPAPFEIELGNREETAPRTAPIRGNTFDRQLMKMALRYGSRGYAKKEKQDDE